MKMEVEDSVELINEVSRIADALETLISRTYLGTVRVPEIIHHPCKSDSN